MLGRESRRVERHKLILLVGHRFLSGERVPRRDGWLLLPLSQPSATQLNSTVLKKQRRKRGIPLPNSLMCVQDVNFSANRCWRAQRCRQGVFGSLPQHGSGCVLPTLLRKRSFFPFVARLSQLVCGAFRRGAGAAPEGSNREEKVREHISRQCASGWGKSCVHAFIRGVRTFTSGGAKGAPAAGEAMSNYAARVQRGGGIKLEEARQILNVEETATREQVEKVRARIPPTCRPRA